MNSKLFVPNELMENLQKLYGQVHPADLKKEEFERGRLYGQQEVVQKLNQWKEASDGR